MRFPHLAAENVVQLGPSFDEETDTLTFTVQAAHGAEPAYVWLDAREYGADRRFYEDDEAGGSVYRARLPRPAVDRLEYLIDWRHPDGSASMSPDPGNPQRISCVFGDHSVFTFPQYRPPVWLAGRDFVDGHGHTETFGWQDPDSGVVVKGGLWAPDDSTDAEELPLLIANDGREFAQFGDITGFLGFMGEQNPRLRCRALLLDPVDRDRVYSASPAYGRALMDKVVPEVEKVFATRGRPIGVGASLGAVSILQAALSHPGQFGGVLLQSGSFFMDRFDAHESGFKFYQRLIRFTASLPDQISSFANTQVVMTCGTGEENMDNNAYLAQQLRGKGLALDFIEHRDSHNYISWRDIWDPALADLMRRVWG